MASFTEKPTYEIYACGHAYLRDFSREASPQSHVTVDEHPADFARASSPSRANQIHSNIACSRAECQQLCFGGRDDVVEQSASDDAQRDKADHVAERLHGCRAGLLDLEGRYAGLHPREASPFTSDRNGIWCVDSLTQRDDSDDEALLCFASAQDAYADAYMIMQRMDDAIVNDTSVDVFYVLGNEARCALAALDSCMDALSVLIGDAEASASRRRNWQYDEIDRIDCALEVSEFEFASVLDRFYDINHNAIYRVLAVIAEDEDEHYCGLFEELFCPEDSGKVLHRVLRGCGDYNDAQDILGEMADAIDSGASEEEFYTLSDEAEVAMEAVADHMEEFKTFVLKVEWLANQGNLTDGSLSGDEDAGLWHMIDKHEEYLDDSSSGDSGRSDDSESSSDDDSETSSSSPGSPASSSGSSKRKSVNEEEDSKHDSKRLRMEL